MVWYVRVIQGKRFFVKTDALILALPLFFILASNFPHITAFSLPSLIPFFSLILWLTVAATSALLLIPLAAEINRYRKSLRQEYSNLQGIDADWLKSLLIPTGVLFGIYAILAVLMIHAPTGFHQKKILAVLRSGFTAYLSWKTFERKPRIARENSRTSDETDLPDHQLRAPGNILQKKIETEKLYLSLRN